MERRLAAILAADVAGYSRMMEVDEAGTLARLKAHLGEIVEPKITAHHGNIVKTTGDGLLAEFPSVVAAVECAVEIQRSMAERNAGEAEDQQTRFRIGINIGDIIIEGGDIFGDGVNIAARLEGLADPGGICVHRDVRSQVRNRLPLAVRRHGRGRGQEHRPAAAGLQNRARRNSCRPRPARSGRRQVEARQAAGRRSVRWR